MKKTVEIVTRLSADLWPYMHEGFDKLDVICLTDKLRDYLIELEAEVDDQTDSALKCCACGKVITASEIVEYDGRCEGCHYELECDISIDLAIKSEKEDAI